MIRHVTIRGRVQGVGYRAWVAETAVGLNLDGWVRNRRDGSVEAVFAGKEDVVAAMIQRCRHGPPLARVDDLADEAGQAAEMDRRDTGARFSVLPTL